MPLSLTVKLDDQGDGTTKVIVRVDGAQASGDIENGDLWSQQHVLFFEELGKGRQPSVKVRRAAINKQERRRAAELGGHRQSGSGAVRGLKGDGRVFGKYRIENKSTTNLRFNLELADLRKIRSECHGLEVPVFEVEFQKKNTFEPIEKWALVPWDEWVRRARDSEASDDR
jgi:hypothetical protein